MYSFNIKYLFGILYMFDLAATGISLQCFELSCNGTNCLGTEVFSNPLLIKKCERVIYKGCYTVTTNFNGFSVTMAGCVDKKFDCFAGTCSGTVVSTQVSCCNTDLCNDGHISSTANITLVAPTGFLLGILINMLRSIFPEDM